MTTYYSGIFDNWNSVNLHSCGRIQI